MNKFNRLAIPAMVTYVLAGCSTQPTAQEAPAAQTAQQTQVAAVSPVTASVKKPVAVATKAPVKVVSAKATPKVAPKVATPTAPRVQTVKKPTTPVKKQTPWQQRQLAMGRMQSWSMGGRAALRFKGKGWTFGLNWNQKNRQQYTLQIRNPITGTVVGILDQNPGKATLRSRGKVTTGPDAERLLQQQLQVKMPVNGMPHWIRGVMAPQYPVGKVTLDAKGRPKQIVQAGWVIDYFNYQNIRFDALPTKVNISRTQEQVNVRILAKQWQTR